MQFNDENAVANTFAQFGCRGNGNAYVYAQDLIAQRGAYSAYNYGGGIIGAVISEAVNDSIRSKQQGHTLFSNEAIDVMLDVTDTGIGALAISKKKLMASWDTATVMEGTTLFYALYSDMESIKMKKVGLGGKSYMVEFRMKAGAMFRVLIPTKMKKVDYQEAGLAAIKARFGVQ